MDKVGIIHISSRNITLVLAEVSQRGFFNIIDELKTPLQVSYCLNEQCALCTEELTHILSTIRTYKKLCESCEAIKIIIMTTGSFHEIQDNDRIVSYIKNELNLELTILSTDQEIYYNYLGVSKSLELDNSLLIEISGTKTNLISIQEGNVDNSIQLPFGHINLTTSNNLNDRISISSLECCNNYIYDILYDIPWLKSKFDNIIIIGEVGFSIAKIDNRRKKYPFGNYNNYEISDYDIQDIYNMIKSKDLSQRKRIAGMDLDMAETLCSALVIINQILNFAQYKNFSISNHNLREGLLYNFVEENYDTIKNCLDYSIYKILHSLNCNIEHAEQVHYLTLSLFNSLKPLHRLNDNYLNILKTASMLHDCGISINYQHHHKHSFYIILNSYINELTDKELLMSAAIASSHRFNHHQIHLCQYSTVINKLDLKAITELGVLLKIAEGLDRTLVGKVKEVKTIINDDSVELLLISPHNLEVEMIQALRAREFFKETFDRDLIIKKL